MNANLAFQILQLANTHDETPEGVVERAKVYAVFIENRGGNPVERGEVPPPEEKVGNLSDPGKRRKGRPPNPVFAAGIPPVVEIPPVQVISPVRYEIVQQAMLRLFETRKDGTSIGREILGKLGVATALDLKPEQYADCLNLLERALEEKPLV